MQPEVLAVDRRLRLECNSIIAPRILRLAEERGVERHAPGHAVERQIALHCPPVLTAPTNLCGMKMNLVELCGVQDLWAHHRTLNLCPVLVGNIGVNNSQCACINDKLHALLVLIERAILDGRADGVLMSEG